MTCVFVVCVCVCVGVCVCVCGMCVVRVSVGVLCVYTGVQIFNVFMWWVRVCSGS